ncbi:MAG: hypothetical protein ACKOTB_12940, partial [Planctomycetia bacterium]
MSARWFRRITFVVATALGSCPWPVVHGQVTASPPRTAEPAKQLRSLLEAACVRCHDADTASGDLVMPAVDADMSDARVRERFVLMHDRIANREMPPEPDDLSAGERA